MQEWVGINWITIVSILFSGIISLIISAIYYMKGNRTNLEMNVILPVVNLLKEEYSIKNYKILSDLSKNHCIRYMKQKEKRVLSQLVSAYQDIRNHSIIETNADILFSYYEYVLRKNKVNVKPVPIEIEGEIVDYDYPPNFRYLINDIKDILGKYDMDFELQECKDSIVSKFKVYTLKYFTNTHVKFFEDHSLEEVLKQSHIKKNWDTKFEVIENVKNKFVDMKVVKNIIGEKSTIQPENNYNSSF